MSPNQKPHNRLQKFFGWSPLFCVNNPGVPPAAGCADPSWRLPGPGHARRGVAGSEDPPAGTTRPPGNAGGGLWLW